MINGFDKLIKKGGTFSAICLKKKANDIVGRAGSFTGESVSVGHLHGTAEVLKCHSSFHKVDVQWSPSLFLKSKKF